VAMHLAAGTSLALAVPTSLRAAWTQQRAGNLDPAFLRVWVPPVVAGVVVGLGLQRVLAGPRVELLFALVVLGIAVRMIRAREDQARARPLPGRATLGLAGAGLGALSTVLGLTGGTFMTPALSAFGLGLHRAVATSAATGVAIAAVGAIGSVVNGIGEAGRGPASLGYVELPAFLLMAPAVWLMAPLGVRVANRLPQRRRQCLRGDQHHGAALRWAQALQQRRRLRRRLVRQRPVPH